MGERQHPDPGSGMNNPDHIFLSLETIFFAFLGLKYLNSLMRIRDPGWKKVGSGINIPDRHTANLVGKSGIWIRFQRPRWHSSGVGI
jgi:hypothetical protein